MRFIQLKIWILMALSMSSLTHAAQDEPSPYAQGILSSFDIPFNDLSERPDGNFLQRLFHGFSGNFTVGVPLDLAGDGILTGDGFRGRTGNTPLFKTTVKYNPLGAWFAAGTYYYYKNRDLQQEWNPDFSYVFGYDDWRPYTFSLVYSNYGGNRINPDRERGAEVTEFDEGTITLAWKFPLPRAISEPFLLDKNGGIGCLVAYNVSPKYFDLDTSVNRRWKQAASIGCKYAIKGNWYLNWSAFFYPKSYQKQPWDPDYTYGFGYFNWKPGTFSLQYNNYSGNAFPFRKNREGAGSFLDGELSLSWSWSF